MVSRASAKQQKTQAYSQGSDHPAHLGSLTRDFADCMKKIGLDQTADWLADPSLHWIHM